MPKYCKNCDTEITEFQTFCYDCLPGLIETSEEILEILKHEARLHNQLRREEKARIRQKIKEDIFPQGQDLQEK